MPDEEKTTLERIHAAAKTEFLEKGFRTASLRNIVKIAGVTTGAFYGYYKSKEELFEALVDEPYRHLMREYVDALRQFENLPIEEQPKHMGTTGRDCMKDMLFYMKEHRDAVHLLLLCSEGTRYESIIDDVVELEVQATRKYYGVLQKLGHTVPPIDSRLEHILVTGMMNAYFEIIIHDMPMNDALQYLEELNAFYTAGWSKIMGQ